jgi:hypothetical protein
MSTTQAPNSPVATEAEEPRKKGTVSAAPWCSAGTWLT